MISRQIDGLSKKVKQGFFFLHLGHFYFFIIIRNDTLSFTMTSHFLIALEYMIVVFQIHGLKYPTFMKFDGDTRLLMLVRIRITHQ